MLDINITKSVTKTKICLDEIMLNNVKKSELPTYNLCCLYCSFWEKFLFEYGNLNNQFNLLSYIL